MKMNKEGKQNEYEWLQQTIVVVIGVGALVGLVSGLEFLTTNIYKMNCRQGVSYYYKNSKPEDFCQTRCVAERTWWLIDTYQGKIDLPTAHQLAEDRCGVKEIK